MAIRQKKENFPKKKNLFKKKKNDSKQEFSNRGNEQKFSVTPMYELLNYKGFTENKDHFLVLKDSDDGYAELLNIRGQGIGTLSFNQQKQLIEGYHDFLSMYLEDMQIMISPFPTDTSVQRSNTLKRYNQLSERIAQEKNQSKKMQLLTRLRYVKDQLQTLKSVERELFNQDFILILFAKNQRELRINRDNAITWGNGAITLEKMDLDKKKLILYRMNNLNTRIQ